MQNTTTAPSGATLPAITLVRDQDGAATGPAVLHRHVLIGELVLCDDADSYVLLEVTVDQEDGVSVALRYSANEAEYLRDTEIKLFGAMPKRDDGARANTALSVAKFHEFVRVLNLVAEQVTPAADAMGLR